MKVTERQTIAKLVVQFYVKTAKFDKSLTVKHFHQMNENKNTIYKIIQRFEKTGSADFKRKTGRKRTVSTPRVARKVVKKMLNSNASVRKTAREVGLPKSTVQLIKQREGLKTNKCPKAPKLTENQIKRAKTNSRKILRQSANKILILDDKTYVPADISDVKTNSYFDYINKCEVSFDVRFSGVSKFPSQYLVWQAADEKGNVSEPYVKFGTLKADEYLEECLIRRLLPFIQKYHKNSGIVFWPDMASIHYDKDVLRWLRNNSIDFIERANNIPNCPHVRPIELFWAAVKKKYSQQSAVYPTLRKFRNIWSKLSAQVAQNSAHQIMGTVRSRLREVSTGGAYAPLTRED